MSTFAPLILKNPNIQTIDLLFLHQYHNNPPKFSHPTLYFRSSSFHSVVHLGGMIKTRNFLLIAHNKISYDFRYTSVMALNKHQ